MHKHKLKIHNLILSIFTMFTSVSSFASGYEVNLREGVTEVSRQIYGLHMTVFWVCVAIAVLVFGLMIYSIINHRKSKNPKPANFHENTTVEIIWTVIPIIILVVIAIPATRVLINLEDGSRSDMTVKVTGYQWKWQYEYMDEGISFFSNLAQSSKDQIIDNSNARAQNANYLLEVDNPLVVPINKKIRLLVTSKDVIHSWWAPDTGVKQDAIPGYINDAWMRIDKTGIYRGQCAELCGKDHGFMPVVVEAKTESDYQKWIIEQKELQSKAAAGADKEWTKDELVAKGKQVYDTNCAACHGVTGAGIPGAFPAMTNSEIVIGDINKHIAIVMDGVAGTAMQAYKGQLNDVDLAAVITYERNALGNNTGDLVQPSTIKSAR